MLLDRIQKFIKNMINNEQNETPAAPLIFQRADHGISRANISENALKVLYRLKASGFQGYLVGGGVRDLLLGREPKDFDVATDAHPEDLRKVFRNCRLIGRRFRLAHVHFGPEVIEVATFRAQGGEDEGDRQVEENGRLLRDNVYGTLEDDAWRRDFTVNSLYYNINDFSVVDYTGGMADLKAGMLRMIGDPERRYQEDPVRMLRAVRFAAKLGFRISPETEAPLIPMASLLSTISSARLFDEVCKLFLYGYAVTTFEHLRHYGLFVHLFPQTERALAAQDHEFPKTFVIRGLQNTDARVAEDKPVIPAFLFAVLLWEPVRTLVEQKQTAGMRYAEALQDAADEVIRQQVSHTAMPRRVSLQVKEIWQLQARLLGAKGKRALDTLANPRFRAAYDFLALRHESGEEVAEHYDWWRRFQESDAAGQQAMLSRPGAGSGTRPKRRRRSRKPRGNAQGNGE